MRRGQNALGAGLGCCGAGPVPGEPGRVEAVGFDADRQGGDAQVTCHVVGVSDDLQCVAGPHCRVCQVAAGGRERGIQRCQIGPVVGVVGGAGDGGHGAEVGSGGGQVAACQRDPAAGHPDRDNVPRLGFGFQRRAHAGMDLVPAAEQVQRLQDVPQDGRRRCPGQAQCRGFPHAFLPGPQRLLGPPGFGEDACEVDLAPGHLGGVADLPGGSQPGFDHLDAVGVAADAGQVGAQGVPGMGLLGPRARRLSHGDGLLGVAARGQEL